MCGIRYKQSREWTGFTRHCTYYSIRVPLACINYSLNALLLVEHVGVTDHLTESLQSSSLGVVNSTLAVMCWK